MENKNNTKSAANKRVLKSGSFAIVTCAIAIALVIFLNLIIGTLPASIRQYDFSSTQLFTLSSQSEELVRAIDEDVTIYVLTTEDAVDTTIDHLLTNYAELSDHITIQRIDPTTNPYFINQYTTETAYLNTVIVESAQRARVVGYYDIYKNEYSYDMMSGGYTTTTTFDGENQITGAIDFVLSDNLPVVYNLEGNGEAALPAAMASSIARQNVTLDTINMISATEIPSDAAAIIINSPTSDLTDAQYNVLLDYLEHGGHMLLFTDFQNGALPRFNQLMENYGVRSENAVVMEGNTSYCYPNYNYYLLPDINQHDITSTIIQNQIFVMVPLTHGIRELDSYRSSLEITPLLTTSTESYGKIDVTNTEREEGDIAGPFNITVAISEVLNEEAGIETRIVWIPSSLIMDESIDSAVGGTNSIFVLNALTWLCGEQVSGVVIDAKALTGAQLTMNASQATMWAMILMIVLPVACIIGGIVIFISRRKR